MASFINTIDSSACAAFAPQLIFVDDEAGILNEYQELVGFAGLACATDTNPLIALKTAADTPEIRVVVTDYRMAKMDGMTLIDRLRESLPARHLSFILLTGETEDAFEDLQSDTMLLNKPVKPNVLLGAVQAALGAPS